MKYIKSFSLSTVLLAAALLIVNVPTSYAAGSASLSLSPSSGNYKIGNTFSVTIYENSGSDPVNVVEAILSYDQSKLQLLGRTCNSGAFEVSAFSACGTIVPKTGTQAVATASFKALASGSASISFAGSSHIYRSTDNTEIWNGATGGGMYSLTKPAPAKLKATTLGASTAPTPTPAPVAAADSTTKKTPAATPTTVAKTTDKVSEKTPAWQWITALVIVALVAGGLYLRSAENSKVAKTLKKATAKIKK